MRSHERRMKLVMLLQSNRKMTVDQIADYFGVSRRTVFRDMRVLNEINVPVTWDRDHGYGIMRGYTIPPLMFSPRELATIVVGLNFVQSQIDKALVSDAQDVEVKIQNVLPAELRTFMQSVADKTIVDPNYINRTKKLRGGNWFGIYNAIAERKPIQFTYESAGGGRTTERRMDPFLMVHYTDHWNVIGYCHLREAPRNFRLNRMSEVRVLNESFKSATTYSTEELMYDAGPEANRVVLRISDSAFDAFLSQVPARILTMEQKPDHSHHLSFFFDNLDFLNEWLLSFGDRITILEPDTLQIKRKALLERLLSFS